MTWRRGTDRRTSVRRGEDRHWTVGEQTRHEDGMNERLDRIEAKVDRLAWLVAIGAGIVAAGSFLIQLHGGF